MADNVKTVFVIAMENHNWTQPVQGSIQQISGNPNAPFINSLVNGSAVAIIDGSAVNISQQVAYATVPMSARAPQRFILPSPTTFGRRPAQTLESSTITTPMAQAGRIRIRTYT
jgi:hypothetical protein